MPNPTMTDIFISTLTELLHHDRNIRASNLARHSKDKATRFLRQRPYRDPFLTQRATTRTAETPDCVSFFATTLSGATS